MNTKPTKPTKDFLKKFATNLQRYTLTESSGVGLARHCKMIQVGQRSIYRATAPIYPLSPRAVSFSCCFQERSIAFNFHTDDRQLISQLRRAMWKNKQQSRLAA